MHFTLKFFRVLVAPFTKVTIIQNLVHAVFKCWQRPIRAKKKEYFVHLNFVYASPVNRRWQVSHKLEIYTYLDLKYLYVYRFWLLYDQNDRVTMMVSWLHWWSYPLHWWHMVTPWTWTWLGLGHFATGDIDIDTT